MNKIYKVIWSKVKNCYVVASELAKHRTKSSKNGVFSRTLIAGVLACVMSFAVTSLSYAAAYKATNTSYISSGLNGTAIQGGIYGEGGIAIGGGTQNMPIARGVNSIAIGNYTTAQGDYSISINPWGGAVSGGSDATTGYARANYSIVLGYKSYATSAATSGIAIGTAASAQAAEAIALNGSAKARNSIAIGNEALTTSADSIALGPGASSSALNSVALGANSTATAIGVVSVGSATEKRRIVNVEYGLSANDAAIVSQTSSTVAGTGITVTASANKDGSTKYTISGKNMTGATASAAGVAGFVPAPAAGKQTAFLRGDGTWVVPTNTTYAAMTASEATTGTATTARSITAKVLGDYVKGKTDDKINNLSVNGSVITYTKGNGTTGTITVPAGKTYRGSDNIVINNDEISVKNLLQYDADANDIATLAGSSGTKLTNLKGATLSRTSTDAVTGAQLYATNQNIAGFATDINRNKTNIQNLNTSVTSALESVSATSLLVDVIDQTKADKSLNNLDATGMMVINNAAANAVQEYMATHHTTNNTMNNTRGETPSLRAGNASNINASNNSAVTGADVYAFLEKQLRGDNVIFGYNAVTDSAGNAAISIGYNAGHDTPIMDTGCAGTGKRAISIGYNSGGQFNDDGISIGTRAGSSTASIAIGTDAFAFGWGPGNHPDIAVGTSSKAINEGIAIGANAFAAGGSIAIGHDSFVGAEENNVVSFGHSIGDYFSDYVGDLWVDSSGEWDTNLYRRLINVEDGINDHDVATVGQLRTGDGTFITESNSVPENLTALDNAAKNAIKNISVSGNILTVTKGDNTTSDVTLGVGKTYKSGTGIFIDNQDNISVKNVLMYDTDANDTASMSGANGTKLTNLKAGTLSNTSTDAVTGSQLHATNQNIAGFATDINRNKTNIQSLNSSVTSALESVSVASALVSALDSIKADTSLNNLSSAGQQVIANAAANAVQEYMASQGTRNSVEENTQPVLMRSPLMRSVNSAPADTNYVVYDDAEATTVTLEGPLGTGTKLTNVARGELSASSTDAVNGQQLYEVTQHFDDFQSALSANNTSIARAQTDINHMKTANIQLESDVNTLKTEMETGFNVTIDGAKVKTVNPANNQVDFKAGDGIAIENDNGSVKISLDADMTGFVTKDDLDKKADITYVDEQLGLKANASDVYTKDETDTLLSNKADKDSVYTKTETDELLVKKADVTYVDSEIKSVRDDMSLKADKSYVDEEFTNVRNDMDLKANKADVYTKVETEDLFVGKKAFDDAMKEKANKDASNIDITAWAEKLGTGQVADGDKNLVTGGTVFNALRDVQSNDMIQSDAGSVRIAGKEKYDALDSVDISKSDGTGRVLKGVVTDVSDPTSAANVAYVNAVSENVVNSVNRGFEKMDNRISKVGASASAMASLVMPSMDGDEKWAFSAAVGHYDGKTAGAVGAFYKPQDNIVVNVRGAVGNGEEMVGAGVGIALERGGTPSVSKSQLVRTINAQAEKMQQMEMEHKAEIGELKAQVAAMARAMQQMQEAK